MATSRAFRQPKTVEEARALLQGSVTENEVKAAVIKALKDHGWWYTHFRPLRREGGRWETAIEGMQGFPDLFAVRERTVYLELKTMQGRLSEWQKEWIGRLRAAGQEVYVVTPANQAEVIQKLMPPGPFSGSESPQLSGERWAQLRDLARNPE
jgi:VRR-NUC domain